jgi:hypothetical protein
VNMGGMLEAGWHSILPSLAAAERTTRAGRVTLDLSV